MTGSTTVPRATVGRAVLGALVAAVAGVIAAALVALVAVALGAPDDAGPLQFQAYAFFTVVGVALGSLVWFLVVRRAAHPARVLSRLVPAVVVASLVPDIALGLGGSVTWGTAVALMVMHVAVAVAAVAVLQRAVPAAD